MESAHAPVARITPAHAGKRAATGDVKPAARDHPRVRGEKEKRWGWRTVHQGSPPRVRGKAKTVIIGRQNSGITPARAGKRVSILRCPLVIWDHPRACGEKGT